MTFTKKLVLPLLILAVTCATRARAEDEPAEQPQRPGITRVEPGTNIRDIPSDPFKMGEVVIAGDILKITVSYAGGAAEHDFTLYWDGIVARSYPGQTRIALKHNAHGDGAEALITKTLEFDLTAINKPMVITVYTDHGDKAKVQYGER